MTPTHLITLLSGATTIGPGPWVDIRYYKLGSSFSGFVAVGSAVVSIDASLDGQNVLPAGVGTLNITSPTSPSVLVSTAPLAYVRANVTSITGGASVVVQIGGSQ